MAAGRLRVCFLAGTLGTGGAEKQLVYMVRALRDAGADVSVLALTRGEHHEATLAALGVPVTAVPRGGGRAGRLLAVTRAVARLRPHVVQAVHTYTGLYAALAGAACGAVSLGALRSSLAHTRAANGFLTRLHLRAPDGLVTNAHSAAEELRAAPAFRPRSLWVVPNAIDPPAPGPPRAPGAPVVAFVGRLVPEKRPELFLDVLARARRRVPALRGLVVGDGPGRARAESWAAAAGLLPGGVRFLGLRHDVPRLLASADMLLLTSEAEGFPNVLLEAMSASLPVLTTPAGDAPRVVRHGETGFVEADAEALAERLVALALAPDLRRRLGEAGRRRAEGEYGLEKLAGNLLAVYRELGEGRRRVAAALALT